jgi:hypothetical protein
MGYPSCRNIEDAPASAKSNVKDPNQIKEPKLTKAVQKIITEQKFKASNKSK